MSPLEGIVVIDFSRVLAGPMATQIMAELGATVIKVERPKTGDDSRTWEPKLPNGESAYFFAFNRGKNSITLNLKSPRGQAIARDLVARADVLIENFLPGDMEKMSLGYSELKTINPRLVYISATGFGQTGPYRDMPGFDTVFQAMSGIMALTGHSDGPPAKAGVPISDMTTGLWIVISALMGIVGRIKSGHGCYVDLGILDIQVSLLAVAAARMFAFDEEPERNGTEHPGRVPSAAFMCRDGRWLHISASDNHWSAICSILGLSHLESDARLKSNSGRVQYRSVVVPEMKDAIAKHDRAPLAAALRASNVPVGEVNSVREALNDPHVRARGAVGEFEHEREGAFPALRTPMKLGEYVSPMLGRPPLLGAQTDEILSAILGLSSTEIKSLRAEGAV